MKKLLLKTINISLLLSALMLFIPVGANAKPVFVKGYMRKNGTYVSGHIRNVSSTRSYTPRRSYSYTPRRSYSYTPRRSYSYTPKRTYSKSYNPSTRNFSKGMKQKAYNAQGGRCRHCGKHGSMKDMEADHIVPYSKGGRTTYSNLQILCRPCNRSKGNRFSY